MKVLTIQSKNLDLTFKENDNVFPNGNCNYPHAKPVYERLFKEYNERKGTKYIGFFWAFSNLLTDDRNEQIKRARGMIGMESNKESKILILDIPDKLCLATDFYNFSDEIYAHEFPNELKSVWNSIFDVRGNSETQVIFPYISKDMVVEVLEK